MYGPGVFVEKNFPLRLIDEDDTHLVRGHPMTNRMMEALVRIRGGESHQCSAWFMSVWKYHVRVVCNNIRNLCLLPLWPMMEKLRLPGYPLAMYLVHRFHSKSDVAKYAPRCVDGGEIFKP